MDVFLFSLIIINSLAHTMGAYLLICICRSDGSSTQLIYLIHLSFAEAAGNYLDLVRYVLSFFELSGTTLKVVRETQYYLKMTVYTGITVVYYFIMVYMTFDRLMGVTLHVKYMRYWRESRTKRLMKATWLIGGLICVVMAVAHKLLNYEFEGLFYGYIYPIYNVGFLILATISYIIIFHKFKKSKRNTHLTINCRLANNLEKHRKLRQIFTNSRFFVTLLIVFSFLLFVIIPDFIYLVYGFTNNEDDGKLGKVVEILYAISFFLDALVYIFLQNRVRNLLWKKITCRKYIPKRRQAYMSKRLGSMSKRLNPPSSKNTHACSCEGIQMKNLRYATSIRMQSTINTKSTCL